VIGAVISFSNPESLLVTFVQQEFTSSDLHKLWRGGGGLGNPKGFHLEYGSIPVMGYADCCGFRCKNGCRPGKGRDICDGAAMAVPNDCLRRFSNINPRKQKMTIVLLNI